MTPADQPGRARLELWRTKPRAFAEELFGFIPDAWQGEALDAFPHHPRIAMKAAKGPGKSCILAILAWNMLVCYLDPMIGVCSISAPNLFAGLWVELARWKAKSKHKLLDDLYATTSREIYLKERPDTWLLQARTWKADATPEQIGNSLAGVHAENVAWFLDETGDYPDAIMPTAEAIFAGNPKFARIVQAGNPTRLSGPLYMAVSKARHLWKVIEITADPDDPNRTPRVSVEHAREQIRLYGRENPWVLVNIFGQFPPSSLNSLIGPDQVSEAMRRYYRADQIGNAAKVLGVDVARFGDDQSVIAPRQGIQMFPLWKYRNLNSNAGAAQVNLKWSEFDADAVFVDDTGGFGAGWIDRLQDLGRTPIGVGFANRATDDARFANKRAEMYFDFVDWIKAGGALPPETDPGMTELLASLTQTTYTFEKRSSRLILEPKDVVKAKLGYSPDEADACALTFAEPITRKKSSFERRRAAAEDWNPFKETERSGEKEWNPYAN